MNTKKTNRSRLLRRQTAPLPVVVTPRDYAELKEEAAKFDADLSAFELVVNPREHYYRLDDTEVALVRRIGGEIDAVRARWRAINRPATDDEISVEVGVLTQTVVTANNLNPRLMADGLSANIELLKPGLFALLQGCRAVQSKYRYLSIADALHEIKEAKRNARRYGSVLEEFRLADFEAECREQIEADEARYRGSKIELKLRKIDKRRRLNAEREERIFWKQWLDGEAGSGGDDGAST